AAHDVRPIAGAMGMAPTRMERSARGTETLKTCPSKEPFAPTSRWIAAESMGGAAEDGREAARRAIRIAAAQAAAAHGGAGWGFIADALLERGPGGTCQDDSFVS